MSFESRLLLAGIVTAIMAVPIVLGLVLILRTYKKIKESEKAPVPKCGATFSGEALAAIAREEAQKNFHGRMAGLEPNLQPIIACFPGWDEKGADGNWSPAFVFYCLQRAGFVLPETADFRLYGAWRTWGDEAGFGMEPGSEGFAPAPGDILLYAGDLQGHMGIVLKCEDGRMTCAEGDVGNLSAVVEREMGENIGYRIRIAPK